MQLVAGGARAQLRKSLRSTARVLAACSSGLPLALSAVLYVAEAAAAGPDGGIVALTQLVATWCAGRQLGSAPARARARQRAEAGSDKNEGSDSESEFGSTSADDASSKVEEDSECEAERMFPLGDAAYCTPRMSRAAQTGPPLLALIVPALPRGALVEVEVVAARCGAAAENGGLHTQTSASKEVAPQLVSAKAVSTYIAGCAWSCTAAAWQLSADEVISIERFAAALVEQAYCCGLRTRCHSALRVRLFVTSKLFEHAAAIVAQISAALGDCSAEAAVSLVPVSRFAFGPQGGRAAVAVAQGGIAAIFACV
jgi:hypothetical protein